MKRYIITYAVMDRLVTVEVEAHNMWEALTKFDAMDISVDETVSVLRIPKDLSVNHDRANRLEIERKRTKPKPAKPSIERAEQSPEPVPSAAIQPFGRSRRARFSAKYNAKTGGITTCQAK